MTQFLGLSETQYFKNCVQVCILLSFKLIVCGK